MSKFTRPLAIVVLASALAVHPAAQAGTIELGFVVEAAGATMMRASYRADIKGNAFASSFIGKTEGISNMFAGYKMNLSANGQVAGKSFVPGTYENDRKKKGKKAKSTGLTWLPNGAVTVGTANGVNPPPAAVAAALGGSASDPLTAILKLANSQTKKPCSGKFRVYDGKDVYDLGLSFRKNVTLASTAGVNGLECKMTYTPIAGVAVDRGETSVESYGLVLAPVSVDGATMHMPIQITGKTNGLSVVVSANSIKVDGKAINAQISN